MQNWNQWQMPAGAVTAPMPPTPAGFTTSGTDPMAMMQSYMQYYNQPAPSGYTAEQWAAAQQQNWAQWQQWQQQFQQWQAQYGEKYQETMKQLSAQGLSLPSVTQAPPLPSSQPPPPLPKEENTKPPLPPDNMNPFPYTNMPPPHQNNLPLFPAKSQSGNYNSGNVATYSQAPPLPPGQPPPPLTPNLKEPPSVNLLGEKRSNNEPVDFGSAKKTKVEEEELTEAEKTFDAQFKQWEEQFNKWKQQNANHPDKAQYKQYEAKWTSWREKLIERREQMRKKREQQKQIAKVESEQNKSIPGGEKILNILSSSENQGLINNLLGIGKTLGLTGKQEGERPSTSSGNATTAPQPQQPLTSHSTTMIAPIMTSDMTQAAWAAQQWAAQYNATVGVQNHGGFPFATGMVPPSIGNQITQPPGNDFSQPPPNLPNPGINFSQPPPGFGISDVWKMSGPGEKQNQRNMHDRSPALFGPDGNKRDDFNAIKQFSQGVDHLQSTDNRSDHSSDRFSLNEHGAAANQFPTGDYRFGRDTQKNDFDNSNRGASSQFGSEIERFNQGADRFVENRQGNSGANSRNGLGNQFRSDNDSFGSKNERFRSENCFGNSEEEDSGNNRFSRNNDSFAPSNNRFGPNDHPGLGNNRLGRNASSFTPGNDRFGLSNDRFGSDGDRFSSNIDRFGSSSINDQFGPGSRDRFGPGNERFGSGNLLGASSDRLGLSSEKFDPGHNRFGSSNVKDTFSKSHGFNENFGPGNERYTRNDRPNIPDLSELKDHSFINDNRRDGFGDNSRGLNRNLRTFEASDSIAPELKKLMEKRKAAMDVFKPRDDVFNPVKQDNIGSLSESFKKITGELPYTSRSPVDPGPRGLLGLGARGPDNLMSRGPGDFGPRGFGPFHGANSFTSQSSRGMEFGSFGVSGSDKFRPRGDFGGPRNEFGPPRGQGNFGPRGRGDFEFGIKDNRTIIDQSENVSLKNKDEASNLEQSRVSDSHSEDSTKIEPNETSMQLSIHKHGNNDFQKNEKSRSESASDNILPLEKPPWMDVQLSEQSSNSKVADMKHDPVLQDSSVEIESENSGKVNNAQVEKSDISVPEESTTQSMDLENDEKNQKQQADEVQKPNLPLETSHCDGKDQNTLPFMGENDPKPEDLNMEPPPELPNLGPITETPSLLGFRSNVQDTDRPPRSITQRGPNSPYFDASGSASAPFRLGDNIDHFGPRGPGAYRFEFRAPNDRPFGPRYSNENPFVLRGPHFGQRGPNDARFALRGPTDAQFGPRVLMDAQFGPRGLIEAQFGPRCATDVQFGLRGVNDVQFGPRGPNNAQFGPRGPNEAQLGLRGPNEIQFGPRGPTGGQFGPRGPTGGQFGPRGLGDSQFGPRGPPQFGPKHLCDNSLNMLSQRALNDGLLGPWPSEEQSDLLGRGFPPPKGPSAGQFTQRLLNNLPFPSLRGSNEGQFGPEGPNESNYGSRGSSDSQKPVIPSLLGLQFNKQPNFGTSNASGNILNQANKNFVASGITMEEGKAIDGGRSFGIDESDSKLSFSLEQRPQLTSDSQFPLGRLSGAEQRPLFTQGVMEQKSTLERDAPGNAEQRSPFTQSGPMGNEPRPLIGPGGSSMNSLHSQGGVNQRKPFIQGGQQTSEENSLMAQGGLGNFDHRIEVNVSEQKSLFVPGEKGNLEQNIACGHDQRSNFDANSRGNDQHSQFSEIRKGLNDSSAAFTDKSQFDSKFYDRSRDHSDRRRPQRILAIEEFRVGKQFNYNHGGSAIDKKISEVIPGKVIDYGHTTKVIVHEYITPAQSFDYGHGRLKPVVPEHEVVPQRDFRHWEETEQSLKEYDDRLKLHTREYSWHSRAKLKDNFKYERPNSRDRDLSRIDRRSFECDDRRLLEREVKPRRERDNKEERRERERDRERARNDRERDYGHDLDREDRLRRDENDSRDRNRDRGERSDRMRVDQNTEYNRNDDRSKGNINRQENQNKSNANTSSQESSTTDAKNDVAETTPKKMELPKMPNYTMVDDILFQPGRQSRPPKIVIILRGPPGSGKSFVAKLIKDREVEQGGSAPRILSLDDYFLVEKEKEITDDNGKKVVAKEMVYEYEEAMEQSYLASLVKAFKKNITDGYFNFIILDCINEKISDYEEMWSFAKTKGFQVYVCEMEMDVHICMKRNIHNRTEEEINKIVDYFEPTPNHHLKLDVNAMLQEEAIDEVHMEDSQQSSEETTTQVNEDSQDSQDDKVGVSKWEQMDADNKLDRLDGLAKKKNESRPQTMEDFLQVPDYYNMEDTPGKKRVRWADLEERKEQEKLRAVGFVVGHTNWDRMMDPTKGQSALTRTKYI